jgi:four helix bundle protein
MRASEGSVDASVGNVNSFKNLEFWKLARSLAVDVIKLARVFPKDDATRGVTRQLVASTTSIAANIAEGHGRYSRAAYRNHLSIARGSAAETENWVDLIATLGLITTQQERELTARCQQIIAALTRAMKRLDADLRLSKAPRITEESASYASADSDDFDQPYDPFGEDAPMPNAPMLKEDADDSNL